ncbi:MAG: hypothetical protein HYZ75_09095 [Elusimicrobia bacterium]|nr:hypothetical protein [Elusimicrobiota bacterium]
MPDSVSPDDPELLLENIGSLDTARMTLRWALERIRGLERSHAEVQELLQKSYEVRQKSEGELDNYKKTIEDRLKKLAEKERFVGDMQRILNDLFKGEVDVAEFVKRRAALDEERATLESRVRRRLEEAESAQKREVEENSKRLTEMESVYSASLAEAQRRFHAELERIEVSHAGGLKAERERYDQFRSQTHLEAAKTADEYQRRLLILEHEYAAKRRELTEDLDRLKARLGEEAKAADAARMAEAVRAAGRWDLERAALDARLVERESTLAALENSLKQAEASYFERDEERRMEHAQELEVVRGRAAASASAAEALLADARAEVGRREAAFQAERVAWVGERNTLRARIADEYEAVVEALRRDGAEQLAKVAAELQAVRDHAAAAVREFEGERAKLIDEQTQLRRVDAERFSDALRQLEKRFHERELEGRREAESDLEALRRHFEEALQRSRGDGRKEVEAHAQEVQTLRVRLRQQQEELAQALEAQEKRRNDDLRASEAALSARHAEDVQRLHADRDAALARQAREHEEALTEAAARLAETLAREADAARGRELAHARQTDALGEEARRLRDAFSKEREELQARFEAAVARRGGSLEAELAAVRAKAIEEAKAAESERAALVRAHEAALAAQTAAHLAALRKAAEERAAERAEEARRREDRLSELERAFAETRASGAKDAAEQLEELRRHYRRALHALRSELDPDMPVEERRKPSALVHKVPRRWPWLAAAALALTLGSAALVVRRTAVAPESSAPGRDHLLGFSHPTGMFWQGDSLWVSDWHEQAVFRLEEKGGAMAIAERFPLDGVHPTGLAVSGDDVFITDSWARQIQRWHRQGGELVLTGTWASPGPQPSALFHDGAGLWSADAAQRRVYRHSLDDRLSVVSSYQMEFPVVGLWADAERFWSADTANRLIHRHRYDKFLSLIASYGLRELDEGRTQLSAFAMRGDQVWLGRDGDARLISRPLTGFEQRAWSKGLSATRLPAP